MGEAMAKALGAKMETVEVSWGNSIAALQADKIDIMFTIDATPERKQAVGGKASSIGIVGIAEDGDGGIAQLFGCCDFARARAGFGPGPRMLRVGRAQHRDRRCRP